MHSGQPFQQTFVALVRSSLASPFASANSLLIRCIRGSFQPSVAPLIPRFCQVSPETRYTSWPMLLRSDIALWRSESEPPVLQYSMPSRSLWCCAHGRSVSSRVDM